MGPGLEPQAGFVDKQPCIRFWPGVVPKEKVALVIVVAEVTPAMLMVNVAVVKIKGLCAGFPAIDEFALL